VWVHMHMISVTKEKAFGRWSRTNKSVVAVTTLSTVEEKVCGRRRHHKLRKWVIPFFTHYIYSSVLSLKCHRHVCFLTKYVHRHGTCGFFSHDQIASGFTKITTSLYHYSLITRTLTRTARQPGCIVVSYHLIP